MNKKILFAAVGAALAVAPMISAQAEVKVGGQAHLSLDNLDRGTTSDTGKWFLSNNSSNIYVHATEDLGGGLKAVGHWESTVMLDTSATPAGDRNKYVGLQGGFGRVIMGHHDDPVKQAGRSVDLFYNEQLGESRAITRQSRWDERIAQSIRYDSNDMGGLSFSAQMGVEDSFTTDNRITALGVSYKAGPLYLAGAYKSIDLSATTDTTGLRIVGSYSMGAIKFVGFYQAVSDVGGVSGTDQDTMGLGVAFKAGNNTFKAQWYQVDETASGANNGATQTSIGLDHHLSKKTTIYATYAKTSNDSAATYGVGGNGHSEVATPAAGVDASGFSLGMKMKF